MDEKPSAVSNPEPPDRALQSRLHARLGLEADTIRVTIEDHDVVRLVGEVADRDTRDRAEEVARSLGGARRVDNRLTVEESEPKDVQPEPGRRS